MDRVDNRNKSQPEEERHRERERDSVQKIRKNRGARQSIKEQASGRVRMFEPLVNC